MVAAAAEHAFAPAGVGDVPKLRVAAPRFRNLAVSKQNSFRSDPLSFIREGGTKGRISNLQSLPLRWKLVSTSW